MVRTVNELITKVLSDLGEPTNGTGFWTRSDVLSAIDFIQREVSRDCRNILSTTAILDVGAAATSVTIDANGNLLEVYQAERTYGGITRDIPVYTIDQVSQFDSSWKTKTATLISGVLTDIAAEGCVRPYPLPTDALNDLTVTYIKMATALSLEITEAGDAAYQLATWILSGISSLNTNGYLLYWELTNTVSTRTVKLYKTAAKAAGDLVAQGSLVGDGTLTLTERYNSGLSGTVVVTYTVDDTDAANILTMTSIELPVADIPCLEYGIKASLYSIEKTGKDANKSGFWLALYTKEKDAIKERIRIKRSGTYGVMAERDSGQFLDTLPTYPWEL